MGEPTFEFSPLRKRVEAYLRSNPGATLNILADKCAGTVSAIRRILTHMEGQHLAYVSGWAKTAEYGGHPAQLWSLGREPSVPKPANRTCSKSHKSDWATSPTAGAILEYLECKGRASAMELAHQCNASLHTVRILLDSMRGVVRVGKWLVPIDIGGHPTALFEIGPRPSVAKPARRTKMDVYRRRVQRAKQQFGADANKILKSRRNGGVSVLVQDGRVVYRRRVFLGKETKGE